MQVFFVACRFMIAVGAMNVNLLAFSFDLAKECCGKHAKHGYNQNSSCCNAQRSQCADKVHEGEHKYGDNNAEIDSYANNQYNCESLDEFNCGSEECSRSDGPLHAIFLLCGCRCAPDGYPFATGCAHYKLIVAHRCV